MNIYITETHIVTAQSEPPNSAYIAKYTLENLLTTIAQFPDLEHPLPTYTFYNGKETYETLHIPTLAKQLKYPLQSLTKLTKKQGSTYKSLMFIPQNQVHQKEKFYKDQLYKKLLSRLAYSKSFKIK